MINTKHASSISRVKHRLTVIGIGIIKTISTSKTKNITARRKKRREKGSRADLLGSNPHSKGEHFSRSLCLRADRDQANIVIMLASAAARRVQNRDRVIPWK